MTSIRTWLGQSAVEWRRISIPGPVEGWMGPCTYVKAKRAQLCSLLQLTACLISLTTKCCKHLAICKYPKLMMRHICIVFRMFWTSSPNTYMYSFSWCSWLTFNSLLIVTELLLAEPRWMPKAWRILHLSNVVVWDWKDPSSPSYNW